MPSSRAVRMIRHAISPRLAMRRDFSKSGSAAGGPLRPGDVEDFPAAILADEIEMIDAAMLCLAVNEEGISAPDHGDVAIHLDCGIGQPFLIFLRPRLDAGGEFSPAQMADGPAAIGFL